MAGGSPGIQDTSILSTKSRYTDSTITAAAETNLHCNNMNKRDCLSQSCQKYLFHSQKDWNKLLPQTQCLSQASLLGLLPFLGHHTSCVKLLLSSPPPPPYCLIPIYFISHFNIPHLLLYFSFHFTFLWLSLLAPCHPYNDYLFPSFTYQAF
jgi:hypothetical protein